MMISEMKKFEFFCRFELTFSFPVFPLEVVIKGGHRIVVMKAVYFVLIVLLQPLT